MDRLVYSKVTRIGQWTKVSIKKGRVFVAVYRVYAGITGWQLLHDLFVPPKMSYTRMPGKLVDLVNFDKETKVRT